MGVPDMKIYWDRLMNKYLNDSLSKSENVLFKKIAKTLKLLSLNPKHPSLNSHEISQLSSRFGQKVFESYLENHTPGAGRLFWIYGPGLLTITVIAIEPHPNDKSNSYSKIKLSSAN